MEAYASYRIDPPLVAPASFFTGRKIRAHLRWRAYASSTIWRDMQASTPVDIAPGAWPDGAIRADDRLPKIAHARPRGDYAGY